MPKKMEDIMASISDRMLKAVNTEANLLSLGVTLENAEVQVGILGSRYVTSRSLNGCVSLDKIVASANEVFYKFRETWDYSKEERIKFKAIEEKIDSLYKRSDELIKSSNIFTKFCNWLREFSFSPYTARFYWETEPRLLVITQESNGINHFGFGIK